MKVGVLEKECKNLIRRFITFNTQKRPYITLKWAESADGFIDAIRDNGKPAILSTPLTSIYVHKLRAENKAILVGRRTALLDNPSLTVRNWHGNNPIRVVIDRKLSLPETLHLFDKTVHTLVFTEKERAEETNLTFIRIDFGQDIIPQILTELYNRKIQTLLVEGGSMLLQSFIDAELWDEIYIEHARTKLYEGVESPVFHPGMPQYSFPAAAQQYSITSETATESCHKIESLLRISVCSKIILVQQVIQADEHIHPLEQFIFRTDTQIVDRIRLFTPATSFLPS